MGEIILGALLALVPSLLSLLGNFIPSLKDYATYKQQELQFQQQYQLALLQAQTAQATAQVQADGAGMTATIQATTQSFKQNTFWLFFGCPVIFSILMPSSAAAMWHNFSLIPDDFRSLFKVIYCSVWGLPYIKGGFSQFADMLNTRWDKKIEHAAVNKKAIFDALSAAGIFKGSQTEVDAIDKAIDAGTQNATN